MSSAKKTQTIWVQNLKTLMDQQGFNPRSLSLQSGLNPTAVRDMLEGRTRFPRYDTALALSECLDVTPAELMGNLIKKTAQKPVRTAKAKIKTKKTSKPTTTRKSPPSQAANDDDLELLTEIITRLHEVAEDYKHKLEARDFAAMTASLYKQIKTSSKDSAKDVTPRLTCLMEYEILRCNKVS